MRIALLGAGLQGIAALWDLACNPEVESILAADLNPAAAGSRLEALLSSSVSEQPPGIAPPDPSKIAWTRADARDPASLAGILNWRPHVLLDLLPVDLHADVILQALDAGIPVAHASYPGPREDEIDAAARAARLPVLVEMGLDPGLDLLLLGESVRSLDQVHSVRSYGAGFPERPAATPPFFYKATWNLEGVLRSYLRPARIVIGGVLREIPPGAAFEPDELHSVHLDGVGLLEAYPNGDVLPYLQRLGLEPASLQQFGRYVLRWPGHAAAWRPLIRLGLLDDRTLDTLPDRHARAHIPGGMTSREYLAAMLAPKLRYEAGEQDVAVVRVECQGVRKDSRVRTVRQVTAFGRPADGLSAMSRTVGMPAAIGAAMLASGRILGTGLLTPLSDLPYHDLADELARRGLAVRVYEEPLPQGPVQA